MASQRGMTASSGVLEIGGQLRGAQHGAGFGPQFAHPELLGPAMGGVIILAAAAAALGFS